MKITFNNDNSDLNTGRIGKTIEEKMDEYEAVKEVMHHVKKNRYVNKAKLTYTPWKQVIPIVLILILIGIVVFVIGIKETKKALNSEGKIYTVGEIESVWYGKEYSDGAGLYISYEVNGKMYESRIETNRERSEFRSGQIIDIYYYEDNPGKIYCTFDEFNGSTGIVTGVIIVIIGIGLFIAKLKSGNIKL